MSTDLTIPAAEQGRLRLFAVNLTPQALAEMEEGEANMLEVMLGAEELDTSYIELVRIDDLEQLGLVGYLREGYDLSDEALAADRAKLSALQGHVLIVLSLAFRNLAQTLPARPDLTLIGTYATQGPNWSASLDLNTKSAEPYTAPPKKKKPSDAAMGGRIATFALLFLFVFTALFIWIAA